MLLAAFTLTGPDWALIALLGLLAGILGGMLGVGGSILMIPGLTLLLGRHQHLYQAAAMMANVAVSVPAAWRHYQAGATVPAVLRWMLPVAVVCVVIGVWVSNLPLFAGMDGGIWLGRILALFLLYVAVINALRLADAEPPAGPVTLPSRPSRAGSAAAGGTLGLTAGLLGIGGGALAVPLQQVVLKLPLRSCIANSAAVICFSATLGAVYKTATLPAHSYAPGLFYQWHDAVLLAAILAPTAFIGGRLGASLTHRLPLRQVRIALILLMLAAAWQMLAIPLGALADPGGGRD